MVAQLDDDAETDRAGTCAAGWTGPPHANLDRVGTGSAPRASVVRRCSCAEARNTGSLRTAELEVEQAKLRPGPRAGSPPPSPRLGRAAGSCRWAPDRHAWNIRGDHGRFEHSSRFRRARAFHRAAVRSASALEVTPLAAPRPGAGGGDRWPLDNVRRPRQPGRCGLQGRLGQTGYDSLGAPGQAFGSVALSFPGDSLPSDRSAGDPVGGRRRLRLGGAGSARARTGAVVIPAKRNTDSVMVEGAVAPGRLVIIAGR